MSEARKYATPYDAHEAVDDRLRDQIILKALARALTAWSLTNQQSAALMDVPIATWNRMKNQRFNGQLNQDKLTRASLLIGLFKGLRLVFNGPLTHGWVCTANAGAPFNGQSPLEFMSTGGIPAMLAARSHLDALRGGV